MGKQLFECARYTTAWEDSPTDCVKRDLKAWWGLITFQGRKLPVKYDIGMPFGQMQSSMRTHRKSVFLCRGELSNVGGANAEPYMHLHLHMAVYGINCYRILKEIIKNSVGGSITQ